MSFTFTNYAGIAPMHSPLNDMIGKLIGGYNEVTKARYLPKTIEADIFHKQISPLAMLASSPYFSSLNPGQQQQIAGYVSQMLAKQGLSPGASNQSISGMGSSSTAGNTNFSGNMSPEIGAAEGESGEDLIPKNASEHFTGQYTQSPYTGGTAHRGESGETIYAPTGSNVQKGLDVLTESKGLKKLFDQYSSIAPDVAGAGGFKRDFSRFASGLEKIQNPITSFVAEKLGGSKVADEMAEIASLKSQMAPALRSIGFSNNEIEDIIGIHQSETAKNVRDRLKKTWPVIERKIKAHQQNLQKGININQAGKADKFENDKAQMRNGQFKEAPDGTIGLYRNGKLYYIPENEVDDALAQGFSYE